MATINRDRMQSSKNEYIRRNDEGVVCIIPSFPPTLRKPFLCHRPTSLFLYHYEFRGGTPIRPIVPFRISYSLMSGKHAIVLHQHIRPFSNPSSQPSVGCCYQLVCISSFYHPFSSRLSFSSTSSITLPVFRNLCFLVLVLSFHPSPFSHRHCYSVRPSHRPRHHGSRDTSQHNAHARFLLLATFAWSVSSSI